MPEPSRASNNSSPSGRVSGKRLSVASLVRRILTIALIVAAAGVVYLAYRPKPVLVDLAKADRGDVEVLIEEDGQTRVKDRYLVTAPLLAKLQRIELRAGDTVEPGQELARLMPMASPLLDARTRAEAQARVDTARASRLQAEAAVKRAQTALAFAEKEAHRQKELAAKGTVSSIALERAQLQMQTLREDLASAQFGVRVAAHQLELAKVTAEPTTKKGTEAADALVVTSPVGGRVLSVQNENEGIVQPGAPLLELGDCGALEVVVDVLTTDAVQLEPGTEVRILRWGGEDTLRGHVRLIEPRAFSRLSALGVQEQRVNVIVDLDTPNKVWGALCDGYRVEAELVVTRKEDVVRIPESAVFRHDNGWATFAVENGFAHLKTFVPGVRNAHWVEVSEGFTHGASVILHPSDSVTDGVAVLAR